MALILFVLLSSFLVRAGDPARKCFKIKQGIQALDYHFSQIGLPKLDFNLATHPEVNVGKQVLRVEVKDGNEYTIIKYGVKDKIIYKQFLFHLRLAQKLIALEYLKYEVSCLLHEVDTFIIFKSAVIHEPVENKHLVWKPDDLKKYYKNIHTFFATLMAQGAIFVHDINAHFATYPFEMIPYQPYLFPFIYQINKNAYVSCRDTVAQKFLKGQKFPQIKNLKGEKFYMLMPMLRWNAYHALMIMKESFSDVFIKDLGEERDQFNEFENLILMVLLRDILKAIITPYPHSFAQLVNSFGVRGSLANKLQERLSKINEEEQRSIAHLQQIRNNISLIAYPYRRDLPIKIIEGRPLYRSGNGEMYNQKAEISKTSSASTRYSEDDKQ